MGNDDFKEFIENEIKLLESWIEMTNSGGWSTHLNLPMIRRKKELIEKLFYMERAESASNLTEEKTPNTVRENIS